MNMNRIKAVIYSNSEEAYCKQKTRSEEIHPVMFLFTKLVNTFIMTKSYIWYVYITKSFHASSDHTFLMSPPLSVHVP